MSDVIEDKVTLNGRQLAFKRWGTEGDTAVIALHGWLDNAASFDFLAPLLPGTCVYAIDLAGHGLSYHRSLDSAYNIWQDVADIIHFMDHMDFGETALLGHSRGAAISSILAASLPDRVSRLILLDGFLPEPVSAENAPEQLAKAIFEHRRFSLMEHWHYNDRKSALNARQKGPLGVSESAATALGVRGISHDAKGYYWHADPRLRAASEFKLTRDHCLAFAKAISCPARLFKALDPVGIDTDLFLLNSAADIIEVTGGHHFHMETDGRRITAEAILEFLLP